MPAGQTELLWQRVPLSPPHRMRAALSERKPLVLPASPPEPRLLSGLIRMAVMVLWGFVHQRPETGNSDWLELSYPARW